MSDSDSIFPVHCHESDFTRI